MPLQTKLNLPGRPRHILRNRGIQIKKTSGWQAGTYTTIILLLTSLISFFFFVQSSVFLRIPCLICLYAVALLSAFNTFFFSKPLQIFLVSWALVWSTYATEIIQYRVPFDSGPPLLYIASAIAVLVAGYAAHRLALSRTVPVSDPIAAERVFLQSVCEYKSYIDIASIASFIGALCIATDMIVVKNGSLSDFVQLRSAFTDNEGSPLSRMAAVLAPGGGLSIAGLVFVGRFMPRQTKILWTVGAVSLSALSVFSAGRQTVLQICLMFFGALALRARLNPDSWRNGKLTMAIIIALAFAYAGYTGIMRNDNRIARTKDVMLFYIFRANINPDLLDAYDSLGTSSREVIAETVIYSTQSMPGIITLWYQDYGPPQMGLFSVPFLTRRLEAVFDIKSPTDRIADYLLAMKNSGRFAQTWYTTFRDLIFDFGITGSYLAAFVIGFLGSMVDQRFKEIPTFGAALGLIMAGIVAAYFPLVSAVSDTTVFLLILVACAFMIRERQQMRSGGDIARRAYRRTSRPVAV